MALPQVCESEAEARRLSEAAEQRQRLERLALMSGGGSMITSKSLATGDDDEEALKRMNVILKARCMWSLLVHNHLRDASRSDAVIDPRGFF